jgi:hypothetical protein
MVLVYLNSGECIEVRDALRAERRNSVFVCLDSSGHVTASFQAADVESFTANEVIADALKEEVCEDLTVVEEGEVVEEPDPA